MSNTLLDLYFHIIARWLSQRIIIDLCLSIANVKSHFYLQCFKFCYLILYTLKLAWCPTTTYWKIFPTFNLKLNPKIQGSSLIWVSCMSMHKLKISLDIFLGEIIKIRYLKVHMKIKLTRFKHDYIFPSFLIDSKF